MTNTLIKKQFENILTATLLSSSSIFKIKIPRTNLTVGPLREMIVGIDQMSNLTVSGGTTVQRTTEDVSTHVPP